MNKPIGVIDSGVGGLTVAKEIMRQLPNETIYYLGDIARCPYGPRPGEEVKKFTTELAQKLMEFDIKMLVIACNTATAVALNYLQNILPIPVITPETVPLNVFVFSLGALILITQTN